MAALLLYLACALATLWIASRCVTRISWRAGAVLAALPLALTGWAMVTGEVLGPIDQIYSTEPFGSAKAQVGFVGRSGGLFTDVYSQMIPWKAAVRHALSHGEWPLWDPFILCGNPLAGTAQSAPYSPVLLLSLLLPLPDSLAFCSALVLLLAALSAFLYARELECHELAALVAAGGWALSSFITFWLGWPHAQAVAFLPLVLLGARRVVRQPAWRTTMLLGVALALTVLAGHPETLLHVVALGALATAWELWDARPRDWPEARGWLVSLAGGLGAGVVAVALTAVYLLPFADALGQSAELGHRSVRYARADRSDEWPVAAANLVPSLVPLVGGKPGYRHYQPPFAWGVPSNAYAGSVLVAPALFGLLFSRCRERFLLAGLGLFGMAAGVNTPGVADLLAKLPLFDITINERLVLVGALALSLLAALGLEAWLERPGDRRLAGLSLGVAAVLAAASAALWPWLTSQRYPPGVFWLKATALVLPPALAALAFGRARALRFAAPALLLLLVAQRVVETRELFPSFPRRMFYPAVKPLNALPKEQTPYRITAGGFNFIPNTSTLYGLEEVRGSQAMRLRRLVETFRLWTVSDSAWFNRVDDFATPFLSFLNVRYALLPREAPRPPGWVRAGRAKGSTLWRNPRALERAFVPPRVRVGGSWQAVRAEMKQETDFAARAWISHPGKPAEGSPVGRANGPGTVSIAARGTGYELSTAMEREGWVVVSVAAWSGWRATEGGKELPLAFANHAFVGIKAPAGESTIRLVYRPRSFEVGRLVSFGTLGGIVLALLIRRVGTTRWVVPGRAATKAASTGR